MELWVVANPGPNAVGCPHPRPNPNEGRVDLQVEPFGYAVFTADEIAMWQNLSSGFNQLKQDGKILVYEVDSIPERKPAIPDGIKPEPYDHHVAYQMAMAPEAVDEQWLERINLFREPDERAGRQWVPDADLNYLRTRHHKVLLAAQWYLEKFVDKRTPSQNRRLTAIKRQLRAIDGLS